jgi:hypothetical protein
MRLDATSCTLARNLETFLLLLFQSYILHHYINITVHVSKLCLHHQKG